MFNCNSSFINLEETLRAKNGCITKINKKLQTSQQNLEKTQNRTKSVPYIYLFRRIIKSECSKMEKFKF